MPGCNQYRQKVTQQTHHSDTSTNFSYITPPQFTSPARLARRFCWSSGSRSPCVNDWWQTDRALPAVLHVEVTTCEPSCSLSWTRPYPMGQTLSCGPGHVLRARSRPVGHRPCPVGQAMSYGPDPVPTMGQFPPRGPDLFRTMQSRPSLFKTHSLSGLAHGLNSSAYCPVWIKTCELPCQIKNFHRGLKSSSAPPIWIETRNLSGPNAQWSNLPGAGNNKLSRPFRGNEPKQPSTAPLHTAHRCIMHWARAWQHTQALRRHTHQQQHVCIHLASNTHSSQNVGLYSGGVKPCSTIGAFVRYALRPVKIYTTSLLQHNPGTRKTWC
jgi:hypothetical protein